MTAVFRVLCLPGGRAELAASRFGPFELVSCADLEAAGELLRREAPDALLIELPDAAPLLQWAALSHAVLDSALVVVLPDPAPAAAAQLLQLGVQDVLAADESKSLARSLRLAIERKRIERAARKAFATDLATGLPNHTQLGEHMSHLLALREREPAPMALIVLRIEGLARTAGLLGAESANVLRRKAAVRLRAGLRASDVVASIGSDAFAVLLAWIDSPQDGERVAAKLAQSLAQPFTVAGRSQTLGASAGIANYPEHGKDAAALLRRALGQAASLASLADGHVATRADRGPGAAANDEEA
ncbi:MAG: GGDEF domain-containing protein [Burkholderiales bacterium]|nr:GGDEF domain-containing protein [Burkholderiales bacterium]